ncbi:RNA 2',3'-cyclic phosphodiesterase [Nocardioides piscis]|uniref:RNA 2',3'-cyclic phosphodiesterase n=1 Tax=Nocardioides piscis TaxID=2714938 RepID=A0A6G7YDT3_9ACTN|nr:RNA 2',3'-cyclic phosphodiesterase [Nocardioides piscis]QIK74798.1 RNA 2',3'-cyclic phosphodiesterase [Nocardioides piscis]
MTRMFVAAIPPPEVVEDLDEFLDPRRGAAAFRWTLPDQWHLTLAFSEHVPDRCLDDLTERLELAAGKRRAVRLRLAGGGTFPDPDRARVLFARTEADLGDESSELELGRLAAGCRSAMAKAGARVDGQRFVSHVTLARLGRPENVSSWVRLLDAYDGPAWVVDEVALVASHLGEGPRRRPRHEVVSTHRLA